MRTGIAVAMTAALVGCKTTNGGSTLNETEVRNFEDELGMQPGVGYDGILEDVREVCTEHDGFEKTGRSQEVTYDIQMIERHSQLMNRIGVSSAAQVKAAVVDKNLKASSRTQFAMGTSFGINQYSVYLLVSARIVNETTNLKNVRMKDADKQLLLQDPAANLQRFRDRCGDGYMRAFTSGGEFVGLIEISTDSDQTTATLKKSFDGSLAGNAGTGNDAGRFESSLKSLVSGRSVTIRTFQRGGQGETQVGMVGSVDEMMTRLKKLADFAKVGQNPRPLTATFVDYFALGLPLPEPYKRTLQNAKDFIEQLAEKEQLLLDLSGNLAFIMQRPEAFVGMSPQKLAEIQTARQTIDASMKDIQRRGKACALDFAACTGAAGVVVPQVALPRRKPTLEALARNVLRIKSTVHRIDEGQLRDGWLNPPECYLKVVVGKAGDSAGHDVRQTATTFGDNRCRNLQDDIQIPMSLIKNTLDANGVPLDKAWVTLQAWEDDPSYDDFIGEAYVFFHQLQEGAQLKAINTSGVSMDVGFEIEE